jgi:propionyl-CoA carboxylase alpha chain
MGEAAVALARAIGYTSAGTVEFILAPAGEFYFIEVNSRLQVEHPVTELTTNTDLVRIQIEIAEGKPLPFTQDQVRQTGHAIEARLCAEDPGNGFRPTTGRVRVWNPPVSIEGLRVDSGIESGSEVGIHYDSLLAKLVAWADDRDSARRKLVSALRELVIFGLETNRDFLVRALEHDAFARGEYDTTFVEAWRDDLNARPDSDLDFIAAAAAAIYLQQSWHSRQPVLPRIPPAFRNNPYRDPSVKLGVGGREFDIVWSPASPDSFRFACGDRQASAKLVAFESGAIRLEIDGIESLFLVTEENERLFVHWSRGARTVTRVPRHPVRATQSRDENASAPMPGQVLKVLVTKGQQVAAGQPLVILEAMKIEQTVRAALDGIVETIRVRAGDVVAPGEVLVEIAVR